MRSPLRFITDNWQLKALALALAVLLWVVVSAEQVTSQWIPVPVRVQENDPEYELTSNQELGEVDVRFTGSGRDLMELAIRKPPLVLSIDQVQGTTQDFRLEPTMVVVPSQLAVNAQEVRAPIVRLSFRRLASRQLPVQPTVDSETQNGWTLVDTLHVVPSQVEVRGAAERVAAVRQVRTQPFVLPASDSVFSTLVRIDTSNLAGLELSAAQVRISGRVDRIVQRRLSDVPISVGGGLNVQPSVVDVVLSGARSVVERVQPSDFRVVVSIDSIPEFIPPEGMSVPVRVEELQSGVSASVLPPAVRLVPAETDSDTIVTGEPAAGASAGS